jgi:hypothetical protein
MNGNAVDQKSQRSHQDVPTIMEMKSSKSEMLTMKKDDRHEASRAILTTPDRTNEGTPAEPAFRRFGVKDADPETKRNALSTGAPARHSFSPGI